MRANIDGIEVEGTPEEVSTFIRAHRGHGGSQLTAATSAAEGEEDERFASEKIASRALRRRPLSSAQRILFRELLNAYPGWVTSSALQEATSYNPNQLGGLLGATGRRLSQTVGYVAGSSLIEWMWDADEQAYAYRLPPSVVGAVRRIDP